MAGQGPGDLFDLAEELLEVCTAALDSIPDFPGLDELEGAPTYHFVSDGPPIPDCCDDGMLAVHVNNVTDRFSREGAPQDPKLNVPSLIVSVLRCVPLGSGEGDTYTPPPAAEIEASARQILADGWALWNHIYNALRADPPQILTTCQRAKFVSMQAVREGQCSGWQLAFLAQLDGYEDTGT